MRTSVSGCGFLRALTDPAAEGNSQWPARRSTTRPPSDGPARCWCSCSDGSTSSSISVAFGKGVGQKLVVDGLNGLDRDAWTSVGLTYRALGRQAD